MKKAITLFLVCCLLIGTLSGCSSSDKASPGKVKISWWVADTATLLEGYQKIVTEFNLINPDIEVVLSSYPSDYQSKVKAAQAAKKAPDIYIEEVLANAATSGLFLDLTPYMKADGFVPDDIYYQPYFDYFCKYGDKYYALPRDVFSLAIVYNKTLFDEAKIPYPEEGWTMDEFVETATKMTDHDKKQYGTIMPDIWSLFPLMWSFGADMVNEDATMATGTINSEATIKFFKFMQDMVYVDNIAPMPQQLEAFGGQEEGAGSANIFQLGKIAMMPVERYAVGDFKAAGMDLGAVSFPIGADGEQWTYGSSPAFSISSSCKHPEETWKFLKYAFGPEGSEILANTGYFFPAVKSVAEKLNLESDPLESVFLQQLDTKNKTQLAFWWRRPEGWTGVWSPDILTPWETAWDKILLTEKDVKTSLDEAAAEIDKNIETYKKQKGN